jgi:hypothetical protein
VHSVVLAAIENEDRQKATRQMTAKMQQNQKRKEKIFIHECAQTNTRILGQQVALDCRELPSRGLAYKKSELLM